MNAEERAVFLAELQTPAAQLLLTIKSLIARGEQDRRFGPMELRRAQLAAINAAFDAVRMEKL